MRDGLYRVKTNWFVAGFVIKNDKVIRCAPILRKLINQWKLVANWIAP